MTARGDCVIVRVNARQTAKDAGSERAQNLVMLGAYIGATDAVPAASIEKAIADEFTGKKARFVPQNVAAFRAGVEIGRAAAATV